MRASGASELRKFWHFHILKLLFPSIFLLVLHLPCLRNIFNFRCQITSAYIYNQCSFRLLLMVWCYINDSIPTNTNIEQMYVYASERASERASLEFFFFFTFLNCYFFQYLSVHQILCRYKWHACRLTCTDKFPNVPKIFQMYRQNSEKALLGPPPPTCPPPFWLR